MKKIAALVLAIAVLAFLGYTVIHKGITGLNNGSQQAAVSGALGDSLIGYYAFDEGSGSTVSDSSGNGNSATVNGASWSTDGKVAGAMSFSGSNSAKVPNKASFSGMAKVSLSAWVKLSGSGTQYIVGKEHSGKPYTSYYLYSDTGNHLNFTVNTAGGTANAYSSVALTPGTWYHVAGVYDGANAIVYVNGAQSGTALASGNVITSDGPFSMNISFFSGLLDEVRVYGRALSSSEVSDVMAYSGAVTPPPTDTTAPVISAISASSVSNTRNADATITWNTNEAASSLVEYGLTTAYGSYGSLDTNLTTQHSQALSGLAAATVYHFRIQSTDGSKNTATSPDQTFTTPDILSSGDNTSPIISAFSIPTTSTSLTVPVTSFTATDNVGVTGYLVNESSVAPLPNISGWSATAPTSYTFTSEGSKTLYAWVKDAAGNVSAGKSVPVTVTITVTSSKFSVGDKVIVTSPINARTSPSSTGRSNISSTQPANTTGTVLAAPSGYKYPVVADNTNWWYVAYDSSLAGSTGWSTEGYLAKYTAPVTYKLTVTKSGAGAGTVTSAGAITCGTSCTSTGAAGLSVTLSEAPNATSTFVGWTVTPSTGITSGCGSGSTCSLTLNSDTTVTATFKANTPQGDNISPVVSTFTVPSTSASLTVSPISVVATDNYAVTGYLITEAATSPATTTAVAWTATAPTSYTVSGAGTKTLYAWARDAAGNVSLAKTASVTVTTVSPTAVLTVTKTGSGVVSSSPAGLDCAGTLVCTMTVNTGTQVTLTATPSTGQTFTGWGGVCATSTTNSCVVTVNTDSAATAGFIATSATFSSGATPDAVKVVNGPVNVRDSAWAVAGSQATGAQGTIVANSSPIYKILNGATWWWNVIFKTGTSGLTAENYLAKDTTLPPPPPAVPTATISANPSRVTPGSASAITWSSTNADSCSVTKAGSLWQTGTSGASVSTGALSANTTFAITCTNAAGTSNPQSVTVAVGNTTLYYPPADRTVTWTPGVTVGVKGGIKDRTTIYQTLSPGASADQIVTALKNCPAGQVVYLNAGTYNLSSQIRILTEGSNCTLRGAGMGKTILKTSAWAALLNIGQFPWITEWPADTMMSEAKKGATSITVGSTAGMAADKLLYLEEDNIANEIYGFGSGSANSAGRMRDGNKVSAQIVKITSVSGSTVTFDPPLNFDFPVGRNPRAVVFSKQGPQNMGVEDLTIAGSTGGYGIWWQGAANSWMKNVEVTNWDTFGIEVQYSTNMEIRESYIHDPAVFNWSKGYSLQFDQSNNSLIENNTFYKFQDGILFQDTSSGNVVAYNTLFRSYPAYNGIDIMLASIFGNHTPLPTKNLYEGNYVPSFHSDYYYGPSSNVTLLRNYIPATDPDALQNRIAVNIDSHQWGYSVIGNILGSTGTSPSIYLTLPGTTVTYANTAPVTWDYGVTDTDNFAYTKSKIYRLGYPYIGNNSSSGTANPPTSGNLGAMDMSVKPGGAHEAILHANWDAFNKKVIYKAGESATAVPDSYYLTSKPSFFRSLKWPPYDAETYTTASSTKEMLMALPSGYRLVTGSWPQ